jgi:DNA-binding GntR family transcriptional regulator
MNLKSDENHFAFQTQAYRLFQKLEREIVTGKLKPGQRLIRRELTNRFGVSQATVSEALWRLEGEGLTESAPMFGTRVTRMTLRHVQEEVVLREALECHVARMLATASPAPDLTPLYELADRLDPIMEKGGDAREGMDIHQEIHLSLARLTQSSLLIREVERVWQRYCVFFNWMSAQALPVPKQWHRILLDAIASRDPHRAEDTMREHVLYGKGQQAEVLRKLEAELGE